MYIQSVSKINAVKISVIAFGLLCGITGILAGIFEISQGNQAINSFKISTISATCKMFEHTTYLAYTLIPNFLYTGIISVAVSSFLIIWTLFFTHKKLWGFIFIGLSVLQLLTGGSFVIDLATITFILSFGINSELSWWRRILGNRIRKVLSKIWIWALICYSVLSIIMLLFTLFGRDNASYINLLYIMAAIMFLPMLMMIIGGLAHNIEKQT